MPLRQLQLRKKNALAKTIGVALATSAMLIVSLSGGNARAVPVAPTPRPSASVAPTANPTDVLPYNGSLLFVLDGTLSSTASKKNDEVPIHLRDALVVDGRTIAPAGTRSMVRVLDARGAQSGDVYGYVDIYFEPLRLSDGQELPLRAPITRLTVRVSAGHESTVGVEDTVADIFIPYAPLYQIFRKGRNVTLGAGAEVRARTMAEVRVTPNGTVAIATPAPLPVTYSTPHGSFVPLPMVTPVGFKTPTPKPSPSPTPTATPSTPRT